MCKIYLPYFSKGRGISQTNSRMANAKSRMRLIIHFIFLSVFLLAIVLVDVVIGQSDDNIAVVFVIDSSRSMLKNDPEKLRIEGTKLLVTLASEDYEIGVVEFSTTPEVLAELTPIETSKSRRFLFEIMDKIGSDGQWTDITAGLKEAHLLMQRAGAIDHSSVILLTDGKIDLPNAHKDYADPQTPLKQVIKSYQNKGWKIYTIGLSKEADMRLLGNIARETSGQAFHATSDRDLPNIYEQIFVHITNRYLPPIEVRERTHSVLLDEYMTEVSFILHRTSAEQYLTITIPDGTLLDTTDRDVAFVQQKSYQVLTVVKPKGGTWRVFIPGKDSYKLDIIARTKLKLRFFEFKEKYTETEPIQVQAYLTLDGKMVSNGELLTGTRFIAILRMPNGEVDRFELFDDGKHGDAQAEDGIYGNVYAAQRPEGKYLLDLEAINEKFIRWESGISIPVAYKILFYPGSFDLGKIHQGAEMKFYVNVYSPYPDVKLLSVKIPTFRYNDDTVGGHFRLPALSTQEITVPPGESQIPLTLRVPSNSPPGKFEGEITIESSEEIRFEPDTLSISFEVVRPILWWVIVALACVTLLSGAFGVSVWAKRNKPTLDGNGTLVFSETPSGIKPPDVTLMGEKMIIGSGADADIPLNDGEAAKRHVLIKAEKVNGQEKVVAIQLAEDKVSYLNGQILSHSILEDGDRIQIGGFALTYQNVMGVYDDFHFEIN